MSKPLEKSYHHLILLSKTKSAPLLKALLKEGDKNLICAITEIAFNLLKEDNPALTLNPQQKRFIVRNQKLINKLASKGVSCGAKLRILQKGGPKFCRNLISPILKLIESLLKQ